MKTLNVAGTDLKISELAYGMANFGSGIPTDTALGLVERYLEAGGNLLDTAHCYACWIPGQTGASDRFVGDAVRRFGRDRFVIAAKGGHNAFGDLYPRPLAYLDPDLIRRDLDESLDRMGLPSIDVYYLHRDDPRIPAAEIIEAANEHVASGRARALGASNWSAVRVAAANAHARSRGLQPFVFLQNQWSLAHAPAANAAEPGSMRYLEDGELGQIADLGVTFAAYSPTANGYFASNGERGRHFESARNRWRLDAATAIAATKCATPNQIALAFLLHQPFPVVPILGTSDAAHLEDALGSVNVTLSRDEITRLSE
jgi:aryl-alcohol dehydrogenase-like predicted oxidoreductase